jgi:integrase/recombinase XerD
MLNVGCKVFQAALEAPTHIVSYLEYRLSFAEYTQSREEFFMKRFSLEKYSSLIANPNIRSWLTIQSNLGLAENTLNAYARAMEDYLRFSDSLSVSIDEAGREHISLFVHDLATRPGRRGANVRNIDSGVGLANATLQQKLTALRLYYDYLIEEGHRPDNPVGRGRFTQGKAFGGKRDRGLIPRFHKLPWIPNDDLWEKILKVAAKESLRNRTMLAVAYDAALRREEICSLETGDIDPAQRLIRVRAEITKNKRERIVPYSLATSELYASYLRFRATLSHERGPLFLSESRRNKASPISAWTWTKVVEGIANRAGAPQFTTHTLRHLCLTDLARAGWDIHEIATFAGHRSTLTTLQYIHLSGRDLSDKYQKTMTSLHEWRVRTLLEAFE